MELLRMIASSPLSSSLLLLIASFLICVVVWITTTKSRVNFPPGPRALPVIGNLHLLGDHPHQAFHKLSKIYGPLMGLRLGSVPVIVASTPEMAQKILQTHDLVFASRPRTSAGFYNLFDSSDIAFAPYGPAWRLMRQICTVDLLSPKRQNPFRPLREEEMGLLMSSVFNDSKMRMEIPVYSKLLSVVFNIISRMVLKKSFSELASGCQDPSKSIEHIANEILHLNQVFNVGDYIPYVQWMDLQGYVRQMKVVQKNCTAIFQEIVDARRERRRLNLKSPEVDLLDVLLSVSEEQEVKLQITDENIKGILVDMFVGGTETSAITTEWALTELLRNPKIMEKAQEELHLVVGNERVVQESDIEQLPYLQAVVKETMRLHPVQPLLLPHESTQPCTIAGYEIPAKTRVLVNVWAIGRDPSAWERPLDFWPERFLESNVDVRGQHFQLLPFGSGRRGCPGWMLGLLSVQMMLATLIHGFEWWLPPPDDGSHTQLDMSERSGSTGAKAQRLVAMASPRLPHHLYLKSSTPGGAANKGEDAIL